ncbi:MAG: hypothetical protein OEW42_12850 [Acidimicrobiia bacterium]|nr:hypothetical protein [Acidimicrobiia bacterium]
MSDVGTDAFAAVVGQVEAVGRLRAAAHQPSHAYLFVGPRGSGKLAAAWAFAGEVLANACDDAEGADRFRRLAAEQKLADVEVIEPEGGIFRKPEASTLRQSVHSSPSEGSRHVVIAKQFHTTNDEAASLLLKSIEEPPPSALVLLLAEHHLAELPTIASRCQVIEFSAVANADIAVALQAEGIPAELAASVAAAAGGSLDRARLLATDPDLGARRVLCAGAPARLDGTGAAVATLVAEIRQHIDAAAGPLQERHDRELAELDEREQQLGMRGSGRRALVAGQKRQMRLLRTDEVRFGLATLAHTYRDGIDTAPDVARRLQAIDRITRYIDMMERNPLEALQLQALFLDLG